ncbi:MAG: hypothetical protein GX262_03945 [Clostridia bacterium]|nr:hypothetical protein [Clostridia bacterium]
MAVVLKTRESGEGSPVQRDLRVVCSPEQLNRQYQKWEWEYNCLRSNWEWFVSAPQEKDTWQAASNRIEQN